MFDIKIKVATKKEQKYFNKNTVLFSVWWRAEFITEKLTIKRYSYAESEYNNNFFNK